MLNIEKYEEELRPFGTCFAITKDGKIKNCKGFRCAACAFHYVPDSNCDEARFEWLIKEYKESVLTDEAKAYLKLILEPSKCTIIQKLMEGEELPRKYKLLCSTDSGYIAILYKPGTKYYEYFKNMESDKAYTPEELGLC